MKRKLKKQKPYKLHMLILFRSRMPNIEPKQTEAELKAEADSRTLHWVRKDIKSLIFNLDCLHPNFMQTKDTVKDLYNFKPEFFGCPSAFKKSGYYTEGDEDAPFFSESFLYNLLGKDDARTLLHLLEKAVGDKPNVRT